MVYVTWNRMHYVIGVNRIVLNASTISKEYPEKLWSIYEALWNLSILRWVGFRNKNASHSNRSICHSKLNVLHDRCQSHCSQCFDNIWGISREALMNLRNALKSINMQILIQRSDDTWLYFRRFWGHVWPGELITIKKWSVWESFACLSGWQNNLDDSQRNIHTFEHLKQRPTQLLVLRLRRRMSAGFLRIRASLGSSTIRRRDHVVVSPHSDVVRLWSPLPGPVTVHAF